MDARGVGAHGRGSAAAHGGDAWQAFFNDAMARGREEIAWGTMACILTLARFCAPSSELRIAERWYAKTALDDLLDVPADKVNDDRLYRALDALLPHKDALFKHFQTVYGALFGTTFDVLLYDITSTYFEGQVKGNGQAQRGYSRDKRPDCVQVCIALVVTPEGLPLAYEVFDGNRTDVTTVEDIVTVMRQKYGHERRTWVMDRGMVREDNLDMLREARATYIVATLKSQLKHFEQRLLDQDWEQVAPGVEVKLCDAPDDGCYLLRTNLRGWEAKTLWKTYIGLTQVEDAFRISKHDLGLRPVFHQKTERTQAHILVCFLALVMWRTLQHWMQSCGVGSAPRTLLEEMAEVRSLDIVLPTDTGNEIRLRTVSHPENHLAILLDKLHLRLPNRPKSIKM